MGICTLCGKLTRWLTEQCVPSRRAAWGYAMCMVAYQVVEEGVCRLGGQHGDMLCVW